MSHDEPTDQSPRPALDGAAATVDIERVRAALAGVAAWTQVDRVPETGSTNADLAAAAHAGAPGGRVLVTEHQTAGRGRFARRWETPRGTSIGMSVLVRSARPVSDWGWLSLLTGVAVADGIERATGATPGRVQLKWPNDVLLDGRKVCGILSERVEGVAGLPAAAIIGMGLNISMADHELPVATATSLLLAGLPTDRDAVIVEILRRLAELLRQWERHGDVRDSYARRCASIGRDLRVMESPESVLMGRGVDVDDQGRLVVQLTDGTRRRFAAGDVHHLR